MSAVESPSLAPAIASQWTVRRDRLWEKQGGDLRTPAAFVFWEAENTTQTDFPPADQNPSAPADGHQAALLSQGAWIGANDPGHPLFAEYSLDVPDPGQYRFFARKFWKHGPFRWRFDDQAWRQVGADVSLLDDTTVRKFVSANWVEAGTVELSSGRHSLRIELLSGKGASSFDAFCLSKGGFVPRGKLRPGEKSSAHKDGWFAFDPEADSFADTPIDLRGLNEAEAGEKGFIGVHGESFVHQKTGQPIRFWAINTDHETLGLSDANTEYFARRLAKAGVNMVRIHGSLWNPEKLEELDAYKLERLHFLVGALKRQGIYVTLSIFFPLWITLEAKHGWAGYHGQHPFGLAFFDDRFEQMIGGWWKQLLESPDPKTGVPFRDDPALALVELINEDSTLFWTFGYDGIPQEQMARFERRFGEWLAKKYGNLAGAFSQWGESAGAKDFPDQGRVAFASLWEISSVRNKRHQDTAQFLADVEREFYQRMVHTLKEELHYRGAIECSNWVTASAQILGPLDKHANAVCDVMDHHGYYAGPHQGEGADYIVARGQKYDDAAAVLFESNEKHLPDKPKTSFALPLMDPAYNGKPSVITELNWTPPNRFRADFPVLAAAYGMLQGTDGVYFFVTHRPDWDPSMGKYTISDPVTLGQFPATALMYRRGMVTQAPPVVHAELSLPRLRQLGGAPVAAPPNLDLLRQKDLARGGAIPVPQVEAIDPLAYWAGRVEVDLMERPGASWMRDLSLNIDRVHSVVRSVTQELRWDYGKGLVTVNSAQAQGATGFLSRGGAIELGQVTVEAGLEYGSVLLVALDQQPLSVSKRMLLQVMSEETTHGWQTDAATGFREIQDVGGPPLLVRKLAGGVRINRKDLGSLQARALDVNGAVTHIQRDLAPGIPFLPETFYYVIEPAD